MEMPNIFVGVVEHFGCLGKALLRLTNGINWPLESLAIAQLFKIVLKNCPDISVGRC